MATTLYLRKGGGGVSGYEALKRTRGASITTGVVNSAASGTDIQWTKTAGGSILAFVSKPFLRPLTISGTITINVWALEGNNAANSQLRLRVSRLTPAGVKTVFGTFDAGVELLAGTSAQNYTGSPTSTDFAKGDRLVLEPYLTNFGTMAAGYTPNVVYDRGTAGSSGDSYIITTETLPLSRATLIS